MDRTLQTSAIWTAQAGLKPLQVGDNHDSLEFIDMCKNLCNHFYPTKIYLHSMT